MENPKFSLPLIALALLTLHCTSFHLVLNYRCYLQNIFIPKLFLNEHLRSVLSHIFFSIFQTFPRCCLLAQNNGNINL